jgi:hypothetical protein
MTVFLDVALHCLIDTDQYFREAYYLHHVGDDSGIKLL